MNYISKGDIHYIAEPEIEKGEIVNKLILSQYWVQNMDQRTNLLNWISD